MTEPQSLDTMLQTAMGLYTDLLDAAQETRDDGYQTLSAAYAQAADNICKAAHLEHARLAVSMLAKL